MTKDELQVKSENYALMQVMTENKINFSPAELAAAYEAGFINNIKYGDKFMNEELENLREIITKKEIEIADLKAQNETKESNYEEAIDQLQEEVRDLNGEMESRSISFYTKLSKIKNWFIANTDEGIKLFNELTKE